MKKSQTDLSIIIVSYNTRELTRKCLTSVFAAVFSGRLEVIVVDNGSVDGSGAMVRQEFPRVQLIETGKNLGFAAANNRGLSVASGQYFLLLNSDTEVFPDTLEKTYRYIVSHNLEIASVKLILPDGRMDPACHRGFPTPWAAFTYLSGLERLLPESRFFGRYHLGYRDMTHPHEIDCPSGAFFWVNHRVIEKVGLLDEDYFMYAEDIDWAWRMKAAGYQIWFLPQVSARHHKKQSGRSHADREKRRATQILFHENNRKFYRKHFRKRYHPLVTLFVEAVYGLRIAFVRFFGV